MEIPTIEPMFSENGIPVFFSCNDAYFPYMLTTIASLLDNSSSHKNYDIFVLENGLAEQNKIVAREWVENWKNACIRFLNINAAIDGIQRKILFVNRHLTIETYFRFFVPFLFPCFDKIIGLDCDLIVLGDVSELYDMETGAALLAGAHDKFCEDRDGKFREFHERYFDEILRFDRKRGYFNAGVLVYNLKRMREKNIAEKLFFCLETVKTPMYHDQDILNLVCFGHVHFLSDSWNVFATMVDCLPPVVHIIHFVGEKKPWNPCFDMPFEKYYWKYSKKTPFHRKIRKQSLNYDALWLVRKYISSVFMKYKCRLFSLFYTGEKLEIHKKRLCAAQFRLSRIKEVLMAKLELYFPLGMDCNP